MYHYDLTDQKDVCLLSQEAESLAREAARTMPFAERSDVIRAWAHMLCEQTLANSDQVTNDPDAYTTFFVDAYTDAYFKEVVALLHKGFSAPSQPRPEKQSTMP